MPVLFGKEKYTYLNMVVLYFKLAPVEAIVKITNNLIVSVIPTLSILATAMFLDSAVAAAGNSDKLVAVVFPLCLIIGISLFQYYAGIIIGLINTHATNKIRKALDPIMVEKRALIKFKYYEDQESVDIMNRAGRFVENLQSFFDQIFDVWNIVVELVGFIVVLGTQAWWASIVFAVTSVPSFFISYKFGKQQYHVNKEMTKIDRKVKYLSVILTNRDTIAERYIYGYTKRINDEYKDRYEFARIARKKVERKGWINRKAAGMLTFISGVIVITILLPSAIFPEANGEIRLSIGMFTALVNAIFTISVQMQSIISNNISAFKYKFEFIKDLNKFLGFEEEVDNTCLPGISMIDLKSIEFRDVSFKYPGMETYILKNLNVKLVAGKHYAIVGINGAGKTTLIKILLKLYDGYEGEILINGKELSAYTLSEMKALASVVYQDYCRYPLDLYHNIAIGNVNDMQNRKNIESAVHIIGLSETVDKLPKKYETPITKVKEDGVDLSGGEWQRIALARLIVNPAPLKILDEPTAALDPVSERNVYNQFNEIVSQNQKNKSNGITIFISHRLGSTKLADEIIVISNGTAVEVGTFDDLMTKDGIYAEMFSTQAGWYKENEENTQECEVESYASK